MDDLEERLRDDLRRTASREEPPVDAWDRITERVQRGERRSTTSRALVGALVLAITAGGLFWLWRGFVATDGGQPAGQPEDLWGRTFVSTRVVEDGAPRLLAAGTRIEVIFLEEAGRRVGWRVGCNIFRANVELSDGRLLLGEIEGTEMGCRQPHQEQDEWLLRFFQSDPRWALRDNGLTLIANETIIELKASVESEGSRSLGLPPYFPTHPGVGGPDVGLQGVLAVRDNCVVVASDAGVDILVLWPDVVGIEVESGVVRLVDEDGRVIASEGDRVSMGGGEAQPQVFREYAGRPPPACPDELWWGGLPIERIE